MVFRQKPCLWQGDITSFSEELTSEKVFKGDLAYFWRFFFSCIEKATHDQAASYAMMFLLWNVFVFFSKMMMFSFDLSLKYKKSWYRRSYVTCWFFFSKSLAYITESASSNQYIKKKKALLILLQELLNYKPHEDFFFYWCFSVLPFKILKTFKSLCTFG